MTGRDEQRLTEAIERVAMVLGGLFAHQLGDADQRVKMERLSQCGFSNSEIGALLGTTANAVNVGLHRTRKAKTKGKQRKKRGRRK